MSRESRTVIISHGSHTIRAGFGIHELLRKPSVNLTACVGLRRSQIVSHKQGSRSQSPDAPPALQPSDYLVGNLLEEAFKNAQPEDPVHVFWPMVGGQIHDWAGMTALWYHVIFFLLPVVRSSNASATLLSLPPQAITRATSAQIHRIFFEEFNTPAFCLVDSALTSTFAVGQMAACIIDIGWRGSSASCVLDAMTVPASTRRGDVGLGECIAYLAGQLAKDQKVVDLLNGLPSAFAASTSSSTASGLKNRLLLDLALEIFAQGHVVADDSVAPEQLRKDVTDDDGNFDVLGALTSGKEKEVIEAQKKKNKELLAAGEKPEPVPGLADTGTADSRVAAAKTETEKGADPLVTVSFHDQQFRVSKSVLSAALTPLSDPSVLAKVDADLLSLSTSSSEGGTPEPSVDWTSALSLAETIAQSITSIQDVDRRNPLWELLVVTGAPTKVVKGLAASIVSSLQRYIASSGSDGSGLDPAVSSGLSGAGGFEESGVGGGAAGFANGGVAQPTTLRSLKTPDYFGEFKDRTDLAPFLGSTIYSKLVFADTQARAYTLKSTYGEKGPGFAFSVAASEK